LPFFKVTEACYRPHTSEQKKYIDRIYANWTDGFLESDKQWSRLPTMESRIDSARSSLAGPYLNYELIFIARSFHPAAFRLREHLRLSKKINYYSLWDSATEETKTFLEGIGFFSPSTIAQGLKPNDYDQIQKPVNDLGEYSEEWKKWENLENWPEVPDFRYTCECCV